MSTPTQADLKTACEALSRADKALAKAYKAIGVPTWRSRPQTYETLATSVAYQLISTKAAAAIWARVKSTLGDITPKTVLAANDGTLRTAGLSRPKIAHLKSIATAIETDALNLDRLMQAPLKDARKELLAVKGIGPWTAALFLVYARGEMDVLPTADIGLMEAYKQLSGARSRLDAKTFAQAAGNWRPYRGVAAHLLWGWLNAERAKS
jgi:DNA-3-methyladenine glycosylase II